MSENKKIGLVLGGGGSRGFAHIAIYKILTENNIQISSISACSIGAVVGAGIAIGKTSDEILEVFKEFAEKSSSIFRWESLGLTKGSLLNGQGEYAVLEKLIPKNLTFEDLKIPLIINAVDLEKGQEVTFTSGNVFEAVMASAAIPGLYPPVYYQNKLLIDGGTLNNLPINNIKEFSPDLTIAVDLKSYYSEQNISGLIYHFYVQDKQEKEKNLKIKKSYIKDAIMKAEFPFYVLLRALSIAEDKNTERVIADNKPDILITPDLAEFGITDTKDHELIYERGLEAANRCIEEIKKLYSL